MTDLLSSVPVVIQLGLRRVPKRFIGLLCVSFVFMVLGSAAHAQPITIGSGTLDDDKIIAPRWKRINFEPLITGDHTITVNSDSSADIRFSVFRIVDAPQPDNKVLIGTSSNSPTVAEWTGNLDLTEQYYLGVWAASGSGNYTATIETQAVGNGPVTVVNIGQGTVDYDKNVGPRWVSHNFDSLGTAIHTFTVSWDSGADVRFRVFKADGTQVISGPQVVLRTTM